MNGGKTAMPFWWRALKIRFSLTTFLVVFTIAAIGMALFVQRINKHKEAVVAVRQWEGTSIIYDHQLDWTTRRVDMTAQLPRGTLTERLFGEDAVIAPEQLSVNDQEITDNDLKHLQAFTRLSVLGLNCPKISDAGLRHLQRCQRLKQLRIGNNENITDAGLMHLAALKELPSLHLEWLPGITDKGLQEFQAALPRCTIRYSLVGEGASSRVVPKP